MKAVLPYRYPRSLGCKLDLHEFGWTLGVGYGQGGLACCSSLGRKESDTTERVNWTKLMFLKGLENISWNDSQQVIVTLTLTVVSEHPVSLLPCRILCLRPKVPMIQISPFVFPCCWIILILDCRGPALVDPGWFEGRGTESASLEKYIFNHRYREIRNG